MIKHIVMWKLKDFAEGRKKADNALTIKTQLEALKSKIEVIEQIEVGVNINPSEGAFDAVLCSEFKDEEALATYKNHPEHLKVAGFVAKVRENRVVVDYVV